MLGIGRAMAEIAALIFTSGYVDRMPESIFDSGRALAVYIFDLSMNITVGDQAAYGSALILILTIGVINIMALKLSNTLLAKKIAL
jgi:phosphate transport system permease protein